MDLIRILYAINTWTESRIALQGLKKGTLRLILNYRINALKYIFKLTPTKENYKVFKINTS